MPQKMTFSELKDHFAARAASTGVMQKVLLVQSYAADMKLTDDACFSEGGRLGAAASAALASSESMSDDERLRPAEEYMAWVRTNRAYLTEKALQLTRLLDDLEESVRHLVTIDGEARASGVLLLPSLDLGVPAIAQKVSLMCARHRRSVEFLCGDSRSV